MQEKIQIQKLAEVKETFMLDDVCIAGLMQLLSLAIATGTNLLDHLRLLELTVGENDKLVITEDSLKKTESFVQDCLSRMEDLKDADDLEF